MAREEALLSCPRYHAISRLSRVDQQSGEELNAVEREWPELGLWSWSPDRREYAYEARTLPADIGAAVQRAAEAGDRGFGLVAELGEALRTPSDLWVLPVDGSPAVEVGTLEALHERWYGDRAVTFACGDEVRGGEAADGFASPRFEQPECRRGAQ